MLNYTLKAIEEIDDDNLAENLNNHVLNYCSLMLTKADTSYRISFLLGLAQAYNNKGFFLDAKKEFKDALLNYYKAIAIMKEYHFKKNLGEVYINIANIYEVNYNYETSSVYYKEAFKLLIKTNNKYSAAVALNNLAHSAFEKGLYDESISYANKAINIKKSLGNKVNYVNELDRISHCYLVKGDFQLAMEYAINAESLAYKLNDDMYIARAKIFKTYLKVNNNELPEAQSAILDLETLVKQMNNTFLNQELETLKDNYTSAKADFAKYKTKKVIKENKKVKSTFNTEVDFLDKSYVFLDSLKKSLKFD